MKLAILAKYNDTPAWDQFDPIAMCNWTHDQQLFYCFTPSLARKPQPEVYPAHGSNFLRSLSGTGYVDLPTVLTK